MIGEVPLLVLPFLNEKKSHKLYQLVVGNAESNAPNSLLAHSAKFEAATSAQRVYVLHLQNSSSRKYNAIQTRSMNDINTVVGEIEIEESMDVIPISIDANTSINACACNIRFLSNILNA